MQLKEVCEKTSLSRKTIRLYEEKELFCPQKERRNGRDFREYSEEDVQTLLVIASLRKAWFTMDEIRRMQSDPAEIRDILPQYKTWLLAQKSQLEGLLSAAAEIDPETVSSIDDLSARMEPETRNLPLPPVDIHPRFKHLDEIEERPALPPAQWKEPLRQGIDDSRVYRQFVASTSKAKHDDLAVAFGQFNEVMDFMKGGNSGPVRDRERKKDPLWLVTLKILLSAIAVLSGLLTLIYILDQDFHLLSLLLFLGALLSRIAIAFYQYQQDQRAWIDRMHSNQ